MLYTDTVYITPLPKLTKKRVLDKHGLFRFIVDVATFWMVQVLAFLHKIFHLLRRFEGFDTVDASSDTF